MKRRECHIFAALLMTLLCRPPATPNQNPSDFNRDPIADRLYRALCIRVAPDGREFGEEELDPLLWLNTKHLLTSPSHEQALKALDEFLAPDAQRLVADPLKRALLQQSLWAVFDWSAIISSPYTQERRELQSRLAKALRRLALTPDQIRSLPDNCARALAARVVDDSMVQTKNSAHLPSDLFSPDGPWLCLGASIGDPLALSHLYDFSGRSVFLVFLRLPQGRRATLDYLKKLAEFPNPWIPDSRGGFPVMPNPKVPQFALGTRLALVRKMFVIDNAGNPVATTLTQTVQIRAHRAIPSEISGGVSSEITMGVRETQGVFEFKSSRQRLLAGDPGSLRQVMPGEKEFPLFQSHGIDLFEFFSASPLERHLRTVLDSCASCHVQPGIHSMLSRGQPMLSGDHLFLPAHVLVASDPTGETAKTIEWKQTRADWRLLRTLW